MRYRWSPLNIFVLVSTISLLVSPFFTPLPFGHLRLLLNLIPVFILGLVIDSVLQIYLTNHRRVVIIELIVLITGLMMAAWILQMSTGF
jgi:hypothetical protein